MKKVITLLLALVLVFSMVGCSSTLTEETNRAEATITPVETTSQTSDTNNQELLDNYPIVGMWQIENDDTFWRIQENGELTVEAVLTNSSTTTVNGVSTSSTSKSISTQSATWEIQGENFMFNKLAPYKMTFDGTNYKLVGESATYVRVGEVDYEIALNDAENDKGNAIKATPYTVGETLTAKGIEMTFSEAGFSNDIRVTSKSSGITITSGPSPEADKQFFYLKGTLKNTGKEEISPAIGGTITLDDYKYDTRNDIINEDGTPCYTIEPLDSVIILIYAHIPIELTENFSMGKMIFGYNDSFEDVDITNCDYLYSVEIVK